MGNGPEQRDEGAGAKVPDDWSATIERFEKEGGPLFRKVVELAREMDSVRGAPHQSMSRILVIVGLAAMHSRTMAETYGVGGALLLDLGRESLMTRIEKGLEASRGDV